MIDKVNKINKLLKSIEHISDFKCQTTKPLTDDEISDLKEIKSDLESQLSQVEEQYILDNIEIVPFHQELSEFDIWEHPELYEDLESEYNYSTLLEDIDDINTIIKLNNEL